MSDLRRQFVLSLNARNRWRWFLFDEGLKPVAGSFGTYRSYDECIASTRQAIGIAQGEFDFAARYMTEREQFGKKIAEFQGLQFMLADMAMAVEGARLLVYKAASLVDAHDPRMTLFASLAKCSASDAAMKVTTDAVQILGGYGYMQEYPVERYMRDAKITQIYEGTNEIQRLVIARTLR